MMRESWKSRTIKATGMTGEQYKTAYKSFSARARAFSKSVGVKVSPAEQLYKSRTSRTLSALNKAILSTPTRAGKRAEKIGETFVRDRWSSAMENTRTGRAIRERIGKLVTPKGIIIMEFNGKKIAVDPRTGAERIAKPSEIQNAKPYTAADANNALTKWANERDRKRKRHPDMDDEEYNDE